VSTIRFGLGIGAAMDTVGKDRSNTRDAAQLGATQEKKTVNGKEDTGKVTWADVVKGRVVDKENEEKCKNDKIVSSALSRNNPVSKNRS
jgi:hypothetical protein